MPESETVLKRTACNRDCPDACGIIATVKDGRVVQLQGDPDHPITSGFLCERTSRFLERQYDPERITSPLLRTKNGFSPISWNQALDLIAEKMIQIKAESGGAAIMHYRCGGSLGLMKHITDYFFERFGPVTIKSGDVCSGAGDAAQLTDFGEEDSHDFFDLRNSKTIVLWGKNIYVSNVHLLPVLREAKSRGARLILIDPIHNRTANLCDLYLQPRPGGDTALALGASRYLFESNLTDPNAGSYCDHLAEFRSLVFSKTVDEWAEQADVRADELVAFAQAYSQGPSAILVGWGMQRRRNGSAIIRTIDALAAVTGNLGIPGGGVSFYFKRRSAFDLSFVQGQSVAPRTIPEPLFGPKILEASNPPIRMVWVTTANPVAMLPESRTVAKALESREFTVVVDSFMTDSARCAHLVLPTTTMLEDDDLLGSYGHHWLIESRPVIDAPEGVRTDYQIVQELARRVGLNGEFTADVEKWKNRLLGKVADHGASLEDLRRGPVRNPIAPEILFKDRKFSTPTGNVNLIQTIDPIPKSVTPAQPLMLMPLATEKSQASQWPAKKQQGPATAIVHPAAASDFQEGEIVRLESDQGELQVRLKFDNKQRKDILLMEKGGWLAADRCANALIRAELTDAGECAVYYETLVKLLPLNESN